MKFFENLIENVRLDISEHSSGILMVGGIILGAGAIVAACIATKKLDSIMEDAEEELNDIADEYDEEPTEEEAKEIAKRQFVAKAKRVGRIGANYALTAVLFGASVFCIGKAHSIDIDNYAKVVAAYNVLDQGFRQYRKNVIADVGPEKDVQYKLNATQIEVTEQEETTKGKVKEVKKRVDIANISGYARFFDELCPNFKENPTANRLYLQAEEEYATEKMKSRYRKTPYRPGYILLNEVYEILGYDATEAGAVVGWIYDPEHPVGDNRVDFGLCDANRINERFMNGIEPVAVLDFNVDGIITGNRAIFQSI